MKNLKIGKLLLPLILLLALFFRLFSLGENPPGLTPDEASLGYNAYSILKTGKDEYGSFMPIVFKSFGDYKPGLYVYSVIPFVGLLGLNEFSVRLPSVLFGLLIVYFIYLIAGEFFKDPVNGKEKLLKFSHLAAFVAAVNPYLIYFSRGAWEANLSLALTLGGIHFFLQSLKNQKYLPLSAISFALTLLSYQGAKLSTLIVLGILFFVYLSEIRKFNKLAVGISVAAFIFLISPVVLSLFNGQAQRLAIFSVFSYPRPESEIKFYAGPFFEIFHSDNLNYLRMILSRWFNYYSGAFMYFAGDLAHPAHTPPYQGILLMADLILLPVGLVMMFKGRITKAGSFLLLWAILAPLSAAISRDQTNAVRSLNGAVPLVVVSAVGLRYFLENLQNNAKRILVFLPMAGFYLFSLLYFFDAYFIHFPVHNAPYAYYGFKQAVQEVGSLQKDYSQIVFEQSFTQPYIYFLFYKKYDPATWQKQANLIESEYKGDVGYQEKLNNITFEKLDWSKLRLSPNTLIAASANSVPPEILKDTKNYRMIKEINYPLSSRQAFVIIETK